MLLRLLLGLGCAAVSLVPVAAAVRAGRRRYLPGWHGAPAVLAQIVAAGGLIVLIAQVLGVLGLLSIVPLTIVPALVGAGLCALDRRHPTTVEPGTEPEVLLDLRPAAGTGPFGPRLTGLAALGALGAVAATWAARIAAATEGISGTETLRYHMPVAARFAQSGRITSLHYVDTDAGSLIAFYPHLNELVHAIGLVYLGTDLLSLFVNGVLAAVAVLAAWCIGRPFGVSAVSAVGALLALGTPQLVEGQAGSAVSDVLGIAALLSACAILVTATVTAGTRPIAAVTIAGAAAGMAAASKYTLLPAVAVLSIGMVVVAPRGERVRRAAAWGAAVTATGALWYLRNLLTVHNPIPPASVHLGPFELPQVPSPFLQSTILDHVFDRGNLREHFLPGLRVTWGPVWWALLAAALAGLLLALLRGRPPIVRVLGAAGVAAVVAYVAGPQPLEQVAGEPSFFVWNVRYVAHGLILGLVLLPTIGRLATRAGWWVLAPYLGLLIATQLDSTLWPTELFDQRYTTPVTGWSVRVAIAVGFAVVGGGIALAVVRSSWTPSRRQRVVASVAGCGVAVAGLLLLGASFEGKRYQSGLYVAAPIAWAQSTSDARFAVVGFRYQYVLYGEDLSNHVQYIGVERDDGSFVAATTCEEWRQALADGHYTHVLVIPNLLTGEARPETEWTETDPAMTVVEDAGHATVFAVEGTPDPSSCPSAGGSGQGPP